MRCVLASGNRGKLAEIEAITSALPVRFEGLGQWPHYEAPEEVGDTFTDNAILKASAASVATGLPALADDSGLCVDALEGGPGVRSARFAGDGADSRANNELLLARLVRVETHKRGAHFHACLAFVCQQGLLDDATAAEHGIEAVDSHRFLAPHLSAFVVHGQVYGRIGHQATGHGGFGYDPLFFYPPAGVTLAEMDPLEKNEISHRGLAVRAWARWIGAAVGSAL